MSGRILAPALGGSAPTAQRPCRGAVAPALPHSSIQRQQQRHAVPAVPPRGRVRMAAAPPSPRQHQPQDAQAAGAMLPVRLPYGTAGAAPAAADPSGTVASYEDEYVPQPGGELPLGAQVARLQALLVRLRGAGSVEAQVEVLRCVDSVDAFLAHPRNAAVCEALRGMGAEEQLLLLSLPAMMQEHVLMEPLRGAPSSAASLQPRLASLAARLGRVHTFYDSVGGLLGYQLKSLQLIVAGLQDKSSRKQHEQLQQGAPDDAAAATTIATTTTRFHVPRGVDLAGEEGSQVGVSAAAQGLSALPFMSEIYPVGGAGDRLGLVDEATGESLPAAMLPYAGRSLMEALLRDLQAREYLYFQLVGRQLTTPVAIMTSDAKGNHGRICRLLADLNWAGRGQDAFRLFRQPMVPVVGVEDGRWLLSRPLGPMLKPGGHGAIWKLMWDEGVFDWLTRTHGRRAAIVRQISNPMAGTDTTLLALAGAGFSRGGAGGDAFGFMSCERAVGAAEGMNVLQERRRWVEGAAPAGAAGGGAGEPGPEGATAGRWVYEYGVTNVEYTEFEKLGLNDEAVSANSKTSVFPANTNVLYVGLRAAKRIVAEAVANGDGEQLLPGLIFNLNKKVAYTDPLGGETRQVTAGRMESTMQNLADFLTDRFEQPLDAQRRAATKLSTFMVSNLRRKVTSSAKKRREPGSARIAQTPDGSFYDLQRNAWQILQRCGLKNVPEPGSPEQYLSKGPGFVVLFHPALGPLWDVISQKIVGGSLAAGAELVLEVAEARLIDVSVDGSLQVYAENVMGHMESGAAPAAPELAAAAPAAADPAATLAISSLRNGTTEMAMPLPAPPAADAAAGPAADAAAARAAAAGQFTPGSGGAAGLLRYSPRCGRVQMVNVRVVNAGIDWQAPGNVYWKHQVARRESCKVLLLGQSEFEAHDVTISGSATFVVPDGHRLSVTAAADGSPRAVLTPLGPAASPGLEAAGEALSGDVSAARRSGFQPSWEWQYAMDSYGAIRLSYVSSGSLVPAAGIVATVLAAAEQRSQYVLDFNI